MLLGLVLRHATLLAGTGAAPAPDTDVHVVGDRIVAIGPDLAVPDGTREIDASGQWLVAGLVDAHVHLMHVPGQDWLDLDEEGHDALLRQQLRAYVAAGVTTVLDTGTVPARMDRIRGWVSDGAPAPTILVLGEAWGPAGGYPSNFEGGFGGLTDRASIAQAMDETRAFGAVGAKVTFERGFSRRDAWPLYDEAQRTALREEAAARGLPLFVHAMTPSDFLPAAELHPHAFVHGPEASDPVTTRTIAESGAWVVTTLTIYDSALLPMNRRALSDPLLVTVVPEPVLAAARDRHTAVRARRALGEMVVPGVPRWLAGLGVASRGVARGKRRHALWAARDLHEAGVPLVLGTDSGTWPLLHTQFPGWASVRERELLAEIGLSPEEVLAAGTISPARMLGLDDEIGTVEVGKRADLVLLAADPLTDPRAWRTIVQTVHGGEAHTPAEWMAR